MFLDVVASEDNFRVSMMMRTSAFLFWQPLEYISVRFPPIWTVPHQQSSLDACRCSKSNIAKTHERRPFSWEKRRRSVPSHQYFEYIPAVASLSSATGPEIDESHSAPRAPHFQVESTMPWQTYKKVEGLLERPPNQTNPLDTTGPIPKERNR